VRLVNALHELSLFDGSLVRRLVGLRQVDFTGKAITVRSDVSANCAVHSDLLSQALHNFLDNALKYTPRGGEVSVRVSPDGGNVRIVVSNTGDGIAPEDLPFIFEQFYRREKSRAREWGGAGIGLPSHRRLPGSTAVKWVPPVSVAGRLLAYLAPGLSLTVSLPPLYSRIIESGPRWIGAGNVMGVYGPARADWSGVDVTRRRGWWWSWRSSQFWARPSPGMSAVFIELSSPACRVIFVRAMSCQ